MSQHGQTHLKSLTANAEKFSKFVWPFWHIVHQSSDAFRQYRERNKLMNNP